jgi:hypothetical protein
MAAGIGATEGIESRLRPGVFQVRREYDWSIQQRLFGLGLTHLVTTPVLVRIAGIPFEPLKTSEEFVENTHDECI